ncbi:MAG: STAS domain-containing protein [Candidatus Competibacterales bacterium]|nr:STAS domain-containing protein [Candidatus Competibacterales bacterium]
MAAEAGLARLDNGRYALRGVLEFATVAQLWDEGRELLCTADAEVDLGGVTRADSAGVALLVAWLGEAVRYRHQLRFVNIPSHMHGIIRVSGLEQLLPAGEMPDPRS